MAKNDLLQAYMNVCCMCMPRDEDEQAAATVQVLHVVTAALAVACWGRYKRTIQNTAAGSRARHLTVIRRRQTPPRCTHGREMRGFC